MSDEQKPQRHVYDERGNVRPASTSEVVVRDADGWTRTTKVKPRSYGERARIAQKLDRETEPDTRVGNESTDGVSLQAMVDRALEQATPAASSDQVKDVAPEQGSGQE